MITTVEKTNMRKLFISFTFFLYAFSSSAGIIISSEEWDNELQPNIEFTCSNNSGFFCKKICGSANKCIIPSETCNGCSSSSLKMYSFYNYIGLQIIKDAEVSIFEIINFIIYNKFIAIGPKNIYNQFQSNDFLDRLKDLCPSENSHPLILFKTENGNFDLKNVKYLFCGDSAYSMKVNL
jgi:hypothetical protein